MANKTVDDLPAAAALNGTEQLWGSQGGATVKVTASAVAALAPTQNHNALSNLTAGDAHPQYLNSVRGDLRYPLLTRVIAAGDGMQGGGDLSSDRTLHAKVTAERGIMITVNGLELDMLGVGALPESVDAAADFLLLYNTSEARPRYVNVSTALAGASGFVPTARLITAGAGLAGTSDLSTDVTLSIGAGTGIAVAADSVGLDLTHTRNVEHSAVTISAGTGLTGGGTIAANRTIALDTSNSRNVDHSAISIAGANSVVGGGDISASRTLQLSGDVASPGASFYYGTNAANVKGFYAISGITISWGQISGTKNADQLQGRTLDENPSASTIVSRNSGGYVFGVYFNQSSSDGENPTISQIMVTNGTDNFIRKASLAHLASSISSSFVGAIVYKSGNQTISDNTITFVTFESEEVDTSAWHDNVTNNTRITVPASTTRIRINGQVTFDFGDGTAYGEVSVTLYKNGNPYKQWFGVPSTGEGVNYQTVTFDPGPIGVAPTDFFQVAVYAKSVSGSPTYVVQSLNFRTQFCVQRLG